MTRKARPPMATEPDLQEVARPRTAGGMPRPTPPPPKVTWTNSMHFDVAQTTRHVLRFVYAVLVPSAVVGAALKVLELLLQS